MTNYDLPKQFSQILLGSVLKFEEMAQATRNSASYRDNWYSRYRNDSRQYLDKPSVGKS